jgi:flagellar M-ring protein FliF
LHVVADDGSPRGGAMPALEAPRTSEHLEGARAIAKQNPAAVAGIVRTWVNGDPA